MPYTPENNPYIPGDPYSYDLKWLVSATKTNTNDINAINAKLPEIEGKANRIESIFAYLKELVEDGKLDYVTPEMFGAIGDGIADDTEAMQKCLDLAGVSKAITIVLSYKTYLVASTLEVYPNTKIIGASLNRLAQTGCTILANTPGVVFNLHGGTGIIFDSFRILQHPDAGPQTAISAGTTSVFGDFFKNITIRNCSKGFAMLNTWHCTFEGLAIYNADVCMEIGGTSHTITGCNFYQSRKGIYSNGFVYSSLHNCGFDYCAVGIDIVNSPRGVNLYSVGFESGSSSANAVFIKSTASSVTVDNFFLYDPSNTTILVESIGCNVYHPVVFRNSNFTYLSPTAINFNIDDTSAAGCVKFENCEFSTYAFPSSLNPKIKVEGNYQQGMLATTRISKTEKKYQGRTTSSITFRGSRCYIIASVYTASGCETVTIAARSSSRTIYTDKQPTILVVTNNYDDTFTISCASSDYVIEFDGYIINGFVTPSDIESA